MRGGEGNYSKDEIHGVTKIRSFTPKKKTKLDGFLIAKNKNVRKERIGRWEVWGRGESIRNWWKGV